MPRVWTYDENRWKKGYKVQGRRPKRLIDPRRPKNFKDQQRDQAFAEKADELKRRLQGE